MAEHHWQPRFKPRLVHLCKYNENREWKKNRFKTWYPCRAFKQAYWLTYWLMNWLNLIASHHTWITPFLQNIFSSSFTATWNSPIKQTLSICPSLADGRIAARLRGDHPPERVNSWVPFMLGGGRGGTCCPVTCGFKQVWRYRTASAVRAYLLSTRNRVCG